MNEEEVKAALAGSNTTPTMRKELEYLAERHRDLVMAVAEASKANTEQGWMKVLTLLDNDPWDKMFKIVRKRMQLAKTKESSET